MNTENLSSPAFCPLCKVYIDSVSISPRVISAKENISVFRKVLAGEANLITCPHCKEKFYFEQGCVVFNFDKGYAVASIGQDIKPPREKNAIFDILGKPYIRLRIVREFICLIEKVRIFEFDLDDRALETVKYKYVKSTSGTEDNTKIILDSADGNGMIFGIYDEYDRKIREQRVPFEAYRGEYKRFEKETADAFITEWKEIDINWAKAQNQEDV